MMGVDRNWDRVTGLPERTLVLAQLGGVPDHHSVRGRFSKELGPASPAGDSATRVRGVARSRLELRCTCSPRDTRGRSRPPGAARHHGHRRACVALAAVPEPSYSELGRTRAGSTSRGIRWGAADHALLIARA
jgi:hypothetical protein